MEVKLKGSDIHPDLGSFLDLIREHNPDATDLLVNVERAVSDPVGRVLTISAQQIDLKFLLEAYRWPGSVSITMMNVKRSGARTVLTIRLQLI